MSFWVSEDVEKSSERSQEAACTIATDFLGTSPKTLKFTECRFYAQGRGIRGAPTRRSGQSVVYSSKIEHPCITKIQNPLIPV